MSQKNVDARLIGIVGKAHGIRGEVNVMLLTDYPDSITKGSSLYMDEDCSRKLIVEKIVLRIKKGRESAIIKFEGINTRELSDGMRGQELFRCQQDCPVLDDGQYWIDDLEGCGAYFEGVSLGIVEKVEEIPSNQNLLIALADKSLKISGNYGGRLCIPLIDDYIENIDIENKKIILKKLPEYI